MTGFSFNLVEEPWIPCVTHEGGVRDYSLAGLFAHAPDLSSVAGESPQITASILRLLLAILHRALGPEDEEEWAGLWARGGFDARVGDYLAQWRHRFDLFDAERPFYQRDDARVKPKAINKLIHEAASGNNATLFDHSLDDVPMALTPAQAARCAVAVQAFALGGLSGLDEKFTQAPCVAGAIFFIQRDTLFETLLFNLVPYPNERLPARDDDRPSWEMDDALVPARRVPLGYLDFLTWQNRRIRLLPVAGGKGIEVCQVTEAPGLRLDESVRNPFMHLRVDKERGLLALRFSESRALWRDSAALLDVRGVNAVIPQPVAWAADLAARGIIRRGERLRLMALGIANDKAKMLFQRSESLPLDPAYLTNESLVVTLGDTIVAAAEKTRNMFWGALSELAKRILAPDYDLPNARKPDSKDVQAMVDSWDALGFYWSRLELPFLELLPRLPDHPEAAEEWVTKVQSTAWQALEGVADNLPTTPRHLKATVAARGMLAAGLRKVFPEPAAESGPLPSASKGTTTASKGTAHGH